MSDVSDKDVAMYAKWSADSGIAAYQDIGDMASELLRSRNEIANLRDWIRQEGIHSDVCTRNILREICDHCRCGQKKPLPAVPLRLSAVP